jgi:hypothetical protein
VDFSDEEVKKEETSEDCFCKYHLLAVIVMANVLAILLMLVLYCACQNRALKAASNNKSTFVDNDKRNSKTRCSVSSDIYEEPDQNVKNRANNQIHLHDIDNCEAAYTALDMTRKNDEENHFYAHYK